MMSQDHQPPTGQEKPTTDRFELAAGFLTQYFGESGKPGLTDRLEAVRQSIRDTGTYLHTAEELTFGARVAWRNSNRCIGRLHWKSIQVEDQRTATTPAEVRDAVFEHLDFATNRGKIRPRITIFAPEGPDGVAPLRFWNPQVIRYAGYPQPSGGFLGDPALVPFTRRCLDLGWRGAGTKFDILPLVFQFEGQPPSWFELPPALVLEVPLHHPTLPWFASLGLKWHALPVISDMVLQIGGINYPAAPFNGWYMVTEIGTRNLGDSNRYDLLPLIADKMGLDTRSRKSLWKDRALTELNEAVLHSFEQQGVTLVDHHTAAHQFQRFVESEQRCGRPVTADWAWIVPPTAASVTAIYHQDWDARILTPNFFYNTPVWNPDAAVLDSDGPYHIRTHPIGPPDGGCPFHRR